MYEMLLISAGIIIGVVTTIVVFAPKTNSRCRTIEKEVSAAKLRFEAALAAANAGYWELDLSKALITFNDSIENILDLTVSDKPTDINDFISVLENMADGYSGEKLLNALSSKTIDDSDFRKELCLVLPDRKIKHLANYAKIIKNDKGEPTYAAGIIVDITNRINMERDLVNAKLSAEAANRAKSQFLSNMSHEIRTPMNAIIGMTNIAIASSDIKKIHESLDKVALSSKHLLGIINDILEISKIESGKMELYNDNFNIKNVIDNIVNIIQVKIEEKDQVFTVSFDEHVPHSLYGDAPHLSQILLNLLSNAVKFTPHGGKISMNISLLQDFGKAAIIQISVSDTGIGITDEQRKKLFKSFMQADSAITKQFGGTGLGLAISKSLVSMMNGDIWLESIPGQGTTFYFTVQLARADEEVTQESIQNDAVINTHFTNKRILLVEDIEINREIVKCMLEETGITIDTADDGCIAVDMFHKNSDYDLIFMDIQMPNMDGYTATMAIRSCDRPNSQTVPIIAMTANAFAEDVQKAIESGMNAHISKPISSEEIFAILNKYL